eukprot:114748_1
MGKSHSHPQADSHSHLQADLTPGSVPGIKVGAEYNLTTHWRGIQNGSRFTKSVYQLQKETDASFIFPDSSQIRSHDSLCSQKAIILIAGYLKTHKTDLCATDIQNIIFKYYCILTIEIYMEKTFECLGHRSRCLRCCGPNGIHLYHNRLGISYTANIKKNEIMFGTFGEYAHHNNSAFIRSIIILPKHTKYTKGGAWTYPYIYTNNRDPNVSILHGPNSISSQTGPEQQQEYQSYKEQRPQIRQYHVNTFKTNGINPEFMDDYVDNVMESDEAFKNRDPSHWIPLKEQPDYTHFVKKEFEKALDAKLKE